MMKPIDDPPARELVPVPPEPFRWRRLLPSLGFVALCAAHELLGCAAVILWYHDRSFTLLQTLWYCAWEAVLLAYLLFNQLRHRGHLTPLRLAAFWLVQALWFALGLWCFVVLFASQPFAIEGVGAWLVGSYLWAAVAEDAGRPRQQRRNDDSYFTEIFKRPMRED